MTSPETPSALPFEPHESRLHLPPSMSDVDVRITTTPAAAGGDAIALRLLNSAHGPHPLSKRLVRCLCTQCREKSEIDPVEREVFVRENLEPPPEIHRPSGCPQCRGTGYRERIGVYEVVVNEGDVAAAIQQNAPEQELRRQIRRARTPSLIADALTKAADGVTSVAEAQSIQWVSA